MGNDDCQYFARGSNRNYDAASAASACKNVHSRLPQRLMIDLAIQSQKDYAARVDVGRMLPRKSRR